MFMRAVRLFLLFFGLPIAFFTVSGTSISSALKSDSNESSNSAACIGCKTAVLFFRVVYGQNRSREALIQIASFICRQFVHVESLVCYGLATQFREEILYVVDELFLQPNQLCSMFIQNCGHPEDDTSKWNISLPSKRPGQEYPTYPAIRQGTLRVLHITDLHLDPKYAPGAEVKCREELCCHASSKSQGTTVKQEAGYWGSIGVCDVPYWTIHNMLQNIRKLGKLDYIMVGGDYESHMDWTYTREDHVETIRNLSTMLYAYFPKTPIYWTLGNHEGVPIDSFAPHYIPEKYRPQWLYNELLEIQKAWLDKQAEETVQYRGSYVIQLYPGLRLISLNSGYCETVNFWLYINETDPDGTLAWLVGELQRAEQDGQYVHILSHIPPGDGECLESWARNYYKIVNRYSKTIQAQFYGHIHVDSFTVFYENMNDDSSKPTNVLYASPSVTTFTYLNPAFRIYEVEPGFKYRVVNFHTYFLNLSKAGTADAAPLWELLYSAKDEYGLDDLSPSSWDRFINKILYEKEFYDKFMRNSNRRDNFVCERKCRFQSLCFLRKGHHNATLCSHIPSRGSFRQFYQNPFRLFSPRIIGDSRSSISKSLSSADSGKWKSFPVKKHRKGAKKLRTHVMKKFVEMFLLPDKKQ